MQRSYCLEKGNAFREVTHALESRVVPVNGALKEKIKTTRDFFKEVLGIGSSILEGRTSSSFIPDYMKVFEILGYSFRDKEISTQEEDLKRMIKDLNGHLEMLEIFENSPKKFYSESSCRRDLLLNACGRMKYLFENAEYESRKGNRKEVETRGLK
jgi:hypothetical protein